MDVLFGLDWTYLASWASRARDSNFMVEAISHVVDFVNQMASIGLCGTNNAGACCLGINEKKRSAGGMRRLRLLPIKWLKIQNKSPLVHND